MRSKALRRTLRWTWLLVAVVLLYAGSVLWSRWRSTQAHERAAAEKAAAADRKVVENLGAGELKILTFYANPPLLKPGERGLLCFGVANAAKVRIEPGIGEVHPSLSRCLEAKPPATTTYTLSATAANGRVETRTAEILVR